MKKRVCYCVTGADGTQVEALCAQACRAFCLHFRAVVCAARSVQHTSVWGSPLLCSSAQQHGSTLVASPSAAFVLPRLASHLVCPACCATGCACELCHTIHHTCPCTPHLGLLWCPSRSLGVLCMPCVLLCLMLSPSMQSHLAMRMGFVLRDLWLLQSNANAPTSAQTCVHKLVRVEL